MPKGFLFDANKCTGCQACQVACTIENALEPDRSWRQVLTYNEFRYPEAPLFHLSMACNHCADAPCMKGCPALAYSRDPTTGAVQIDGQACIGCRYCSWVCPYDAPRYDAKSGVMTKCTFCNHRLEQNLEPACVALCPTTALQYGQLEDEQWLPHIPGFANLRLQPSIRFAALEQRRPQPAIETPRKNPIGPAIPSQITLRAEWPLALFTLTAAGLVAWWAAALSHAVPLHPWAFLAIGGLGMTLGSSHLGKKSRAWRAVLNLRHSWLSREIALYSFFLLLCSALLLLQPPGRFLHLLAGLVGFAALFAMDRVYDVVTSDNRPPLRRADILLTGLYGATLLTGLLWPVLGLATFKLVLYVRRKRRPEDPRGTSATLWSVLRLGAGYLLPGLCAILRPAHWKELVFLGVAVGELVDRCEYYSEVEPQTPRREMENDLHHRLSRSR